MRQTTLADLQGENAAVILGTIAPLLHKLERQTGASIYTRHGERLHNLADRYRTEAMSGNYANLCAVSERYALEHLATTLRAREGDLTDYEQDEAYAGDHEEDW